MSQCPGAWKAQMPVGRPFDLALGGAAGGVASLAVGKKLRGGDSARFDVGVASSCAR
jgi:hypothetical protein